MSTVPYSGPEWRQVRKGWWLHFVIGSALWVLLLPVWTIGVFTVWQRPGGTSLTRRLTWSVFLTVAMALVVPIFFIIPWSRRWYWYWRQGQSVQAADSPNARLEEMWMRVKGVFRAGAPTIAGSPVARTWGDAAAQVFREPWRKLVMDAGENLARFGQVMATAPAGMARQQLDQLSAQLRDAADGAWRVASHGQGLEDMIGAQPAALAERLAMARDSVREGSTSPGAEREMAALEAEEASILRMQEAVSRIQGDLRLLVAQLSANVTQAIELFWVTFDASAPGGRGSDLQAVLDRMTALQQAFDSLEAIRH